VDHILDFSGGMSTATVFLDVEEASDKTMEESCVENVATDGNYSVCFTNFPHLTSFRVMCGSELTERKTEKCGPTS
jgi:hypothetical protein